MPFRIVLCLVLFVAVPVVSFAQAPDVVAVSHTYEARIRRKSQHDAGSGERRGTGEETRPVAIPERHGFEHQESGLTLHQRFGFPNTTHQKVS